MYYVRFLKAPIITKATKETFTIKALINVTTDLGEENCPDDVKLEVTLKSLTLIHPAKKRSMTWKGSKHQMSIELDVKRIKIPKGEELYMCILPGDRGASFVQMRGGKHVLTLPHILGVRSGLIKRENDHKDPEEPSTRTLRIWPSYGCLQNELTHYWEDMGPSIDKHAWDAGMALSALWDSLIFRIFGELTRKDLSHCPLALSELVLKTRDLRVIELGAGIGVAGLTLAFGRASQSHQDEAGQCTTTLVLTDLESARPILEQNIKELFNHGTTLGNATLDISFTPLEWESPLPSEIEKQEFDLAMVTDCTYNPDSAPALVATLKALAYRSPEILVAVASKTRHDSEFVFWERMAEAGFEQEENRRIYLPQSPIKYGFRDAQYVTVDVFMMKK